MPNALAAHYNPSTGKVHFSNATGKIGGTPIVVSAGDLCAGPCPIGDSTVVAGCDVPCFPYYPAYWYTAISGIRRCSDNSIIPRIDFCLPWVSGTLWSTTIAWEGTTVTVRMNISGCIVSYTEIYDDDNIWFFDEEHEIPHSGGHTARPENEFELSHCGASWPYPTKTVAGYGGLISICDTRFTWEECEA